MKQGTGIPHVFALIIIFLVGIIIFGATFISGERNNPLDNSAEKNFCDARAHYVLAGLLRTPFTNQEILEQEELSSIKQQLSLIYKPTFTDFFGANSWDSADHQVLRNGLEEEIKQVTGIETMGLFLRNDNGQTNILMAPTGWPADSIGTAEIIIPGIEQTQTIHIAMRCSFLW